VVGKRVETFLETILNFESFSENNEIAVPLDRLCWNVVLQYLWLEEGYRG